MTPQDPPPDSASRKFVSTETFDLEYLARVHGTSTEEVKKVMAEIGSQSRDELEKALERKFRYAPRTYGGTRDPQLDRVESGKAGMPAAPGAEDEDGGNPEAKATPGAEEDKGGKPGTQTTPGAEDNKGGTPPQRAI